MLIWSCQETQQKNNEPELVEFNNSLGQAKAEALNQAVASLDSFLLTNFQEQNDQQQRAITLLEQIRRDNWPDPSWILRTEENKKILEDFEKSGLRKEFRIYDYEEYSNVIDEEFFQMELGDTIQTMPEIDSSARFNFFGQFLVSLDEAIKTDTLTKSYVDARQAGNISYSLLAEGLLFYNVNYSNPIHKRIMVIDFYYDLMLWDLERKRIKKQA